MIKTNIGGIINIVFKYGPGYRKNLKQLCVSQFYSEEELEAYKNEKLKAIIRHSYNNVQYYNELFNKLKLKPEDICTANDLHKLPVITKQDIIDNYDKFISKNVQQIR